MELTVYRHYQSGSKVLCTYAMLPFFCNTGDQTTQSRCPFGVHPGSTLLNRWAAVSCEVVKQIQRLFPRLLATTMETLADPTDVNKFYNYSFKVSDISQRQQSPFFNLFQIQGGLQDCIVG